MSQQARLEIQNYKDGHTHVAINNGLRAEPAQARAADVARLLKKYNIENMIKAIGGAPPTDQGFYGFRHVANFPLENGKTLKDLQIGDTFSDPGFSSASYAPNWAKEVRDCCVQVTLYPKGSKILLPDVLASDEEIGQEEEVLTYPGMEFRLHRVQVLHIFPSQTLRGQKPQPKTTVKVLHCEIVGNMWNRGWLV